MLTDQQLAAIPDRHLRPHRLGALDLIEWLGTHGWRMTLEELEGERKRRGLR